MTRAAWLTLGFAVGIVVAVLVLAPADWIVALEGRIAGWRPWLGGLRAVAIAGVWIGWNGLVARIPGLTAEGVAHLRSRRHFWCGALAAVELALVRNLPGALWHLAA